MSRPTRDSEHFEGRLEPRPGGIGARLGQPRGSEGGGEGGARGMAHGGTDARAMIEGGREVVSARYRSGRHEETGVGRHRSGREEREVPRRDQEVHFDARNLLGKRNYPFEDAYK